MPSFRSVGEALNNAIMESIWSSTENGLVHHKRWTTRIELSNTMFDYFEVIYNRHRRHSKISYASPTDYERMLDQETSMPNRDAGNQACSRSMEQQSLQQVRMSPILGSRSEGQRHFIATGGKDH